jgi:hypothetical protein
MKKILWRVANAIQFSHYEAKHASPAVLIIDATAAQMGCLTCEWDFTKRSVTPCEAHS